MNATRTSKAQGKPASAPRRKPAKTDWAALRQMSDEEAEARARADQDNPPSTPRQLARMKRVALAKRIRWSLGLSQQEFADRYGIPLGTLRDWEQHRSEPDQSALSYLKAIASEPEAIAKALENA